MSEIEKLRELLFSEEKKTLQNIKQRTESPGARTRDVAEVLPGAISASYRRDTALIQSLREPVSECFQDAVRANPRSFADALFPVIGPAIRKSIAETFKSLVQSLNQTMEYSLSPRGLKWRFEAARAGVPLGEYILRKTLVYRIEQVYLIQRERGLMAGHVQNERAVAQDADAVSAMFTAIEDFVSDSFSPDHDQLLETADIGEFTVWVLHGPHSMMACVIRGVPPRGLRDELTAILERINLRYGEALKNFDGDSAKLAGVETMLAECLELEQRQDQGGDGKRLLSPPLVILLTLVGAALLWWAVSSYIDARRTDAFRDAVAETPGLVATELEVNGRRLRIRGLADPMAATVEEVAAAAGLEYTDIDADLSPFQSLEPEIVLRRARRALRPPAGIALALEGDVLMASGQADDDWRNSFTARAPLIAGVGRGDASATVPGDAALLALSRSVLSPPANVAMNVTQRRLTISGVAPQAWIDGLPAGLDRIEGLQQVDTAGLAAEERSRLALMVRQLSGRAFYFESGASLVDTRNTALAATAAQLSEMLDLADRLDQPVSIRIVGFSDGVGEPGSNQALMRQRAEAVRAGFVIQGLDPDRIEVATAALPDAPGPDAALRKAVLELGLADDE